MKLRIVLVLILVLASSVFPQTRSAGALKALVGGTLIDGYGSTPIRITAGGSCRSIARLLRRRVRGR